MLFRINATVVINGKIRSISAVADAKDKADATNKAKANLKSEHGDAWEITSVKPFGQAK